MENALTARAETNNDVPLRDPGAVYKLNAGRASRQTAHGYVSLKEAALIVGVHTDTIRRAVSSGDLAAYRIGKQYRIAAADLDRWIEGKRVEPSEGFSRTIYGSPTNEYRW